MLGALVTVVVSSVFYFLSVAEPLERASYDNLLRFGGRTVTNKVAIILMDNSAYAALQQSREHPWARSEHARLLNKLAADGCPLVVMDIFFRSEGDPKVDRQLTDAMARLQHVLLAARQDSVSHPGLVAANPELPAEKFLTAAKSEWGVAWLDPDQDSIVRKHWPDPSPGPYRSLPWRAAEISGARLSTTPSERWIRYYDSDTAFVCMSYHLALAKGPGYFTNTTVFIGSDPQTTLPDREQDEYQTPQFNWTGSTVGGVKILATIYLNLVNGDWLVRAPEWAEAGSIILLGAAIGWLLALMKKRMAFGIGAAVAFTAMIGCVLLTSGTNYWFPWLLISGFQVPCAVAFAILYPVKIDPKKAIVDGPTEVLEKLPDAPEFEIFKPYIGKGAFGKVWIVRNAIGQWQALKAVYASSFSGNIAPYEAEFKGLQRYKPVSEKHPGLLRIDMISRMKEEGYFYYVMELGDAVEPDWEPDPARYKPLDLEALRRKQNGGRLPFYDCVRIVRQLALALQFLHQQGLTHRDIKPSNVIFVKGLPKLADVGLVAHIRPPEEVQTLVGTPGYMPPPPEPTGTPQADIYSLGMLLYVISTGNQPGFFPEVNTTIMARSEDPGFAVINPIIVKACQPDINQRYQTAGQMLEDLRLALEKELPENRVAALSWQAAESNPGSQQDVSPSKAKKARLDLWAGADRYGFARLAIVFSDIIGSTEQNARLGNLEWARIRSAHLAQASRLVEQHEGRYVKDVGDEVIAVFKDDIHALEYALSLESDPGHASLSIRVGVNFGKVEIANEDIFGNEVNLTARIMAAASEGGIWVSDIVRNDWIGQHGTNSISFNRHAGVTLKGRDEPVTLWALPKSKT